MFDFIVNGTGTMSLFSPTVPDDEAAGLYRYSIKTNLPSGGTNDSVLSLAHRCRLVVTEKCIINSCERAIHTEHMDEMNSL
jgi:hypothetical protein